MAIAGLPEGNGEKMRAAVYYGKKDIRIETVSKPKCKDDEVMVKVAFNGICGRLPKLAYQIAQTSILIQMVHLCLFLRY